PGAGEEAPLLLLTGQTYRTRILSVGLCGGYATDKCEIVSRAARWQRVRRRGGCGCERASGKDTRSVFQLERQRPDSGCLCSHGRKSPSLRTEKTLRSISQGLAHHRMRQRIFDGSSRPAISEAGGRD